MIINRYRQLAPALACVGALFAASTVMAQGQVNVVAEPTTHPGDRQPLHRATPEEVAVTSCLTAFMNELFPGRHPVVHTVIRLNGDDPVRPSYSTMGVTVEATTRSSGQLIAQSQCTVSLRTSKVRALHTEVRNPSLLASVGPQDLSMKVANR